MDALLTMAGHGRSSLPLDVLAGLTLLSIAPFVLVLSTSFVRIIVVLSLVRSAIGAPLRVDGTAIGFQRVGAGPAVEPVLALAQ